MAGHPLRPATRRSLGEPLPHQPADRTRAHPVAHLCFNPKAYGVLGSVSERYPPRQDSFSCFTHPSATPYVAPRCHFTTPSSNLHVLRTPPAFILSQDQTLSNLLPVSLKLNTTTSTKRHRRFILRFLYGSPVNLSSSKIQKSP